MWGWPGVDRRVYLAGGGGLTAQLERGLDAVREEVALDVEELGVLDERGDRGRREMRVLEFLRDAEGGDERAGAPYLELQRIIDDG